MINLLNLLIGLGIFTFGLFSVACLFVSGKILLGFLVIALTLFALLDCFVFN